MEIRQLFNTVYRYLWILVILPLITSLAAVYYNNHMLTPIYETGATIYVGKDFNSYAPIAVNDLTLGEKLINDYSELIKSRLLTSEVIQEMGLQDLSPTALASKITVSARNGTRFMSVRVHDTNPTRAMDLANKVAEVFISKATKLMRIDSISLIDKAELPVYPIYPKPARNIILGFFAGLCAAAAIIFIVEYLDDTIKTSGGIEKQLGFVVLGSIPEFRIK